jgi:hypothetical protein
MAEVRLSTAIDLNINDDDIYKLSTKEQSNTLKRINTLNYVSPDHPLLSPRRARSADNMIEIRSRVRHYTAF